MVVAMTVTVVVEWRQNACATHRPRVPLARRGLALLAL
jgi:hypothetical protein